MKIQNTLDAKAPAIKIVVAGEAGNGKTTLADTIQSELKENVLVISAEAGLLSLRGRGIDYQELQTRHDIEKDIWVEVPKVERIARLMDIFNWLRLPETQVKYQWIFIDSLSEINQNMLELIESIDEFKGPSNTIKKYGELATRMRSLAKAFRDLPHYNIVFTALVKSETSPDGVPVMKIDMTGKFADVLPSLFDEIFYLGVMPDVGDDGRNHRMLLTQKTDRILFPKDRSGKLSRTEPANLGQVVKKIRAMPVLGDISAQAKAAHELTTKAKVDAAQVKPGHEAEGDSLRAKQAKPAAAH